MYTIRRSRQFKKDVAKLLKRGKDINKLLKVVEDLSMGQELAPELKDHPLKGKYINKRDCHIEPDWILIYAIEGNELILYRTGSHADIFY